jgi:WD40 repeat protein/nucleoside phosphorylase
MSGEATDVLFVTALADELEAVLDLGDGGREGWEERRDKNGFPYYRRVIHNERSLALRVAAAWSGEMGETSAAIRATDLIKELDPACIAMCGICAGRRGEVALGDVIIADRVYSYDSGKNVGGAGERSAGFFHDIATCNIDKTWAMDASLFARELGSRHALAKQRPLSRGTQERWLLHEIAAHARGPGLDPRSHPERSARCPDWEPTIMALRAKGLVSSEKGKLKLTESGVAQVEEDELLYPDGLPDDPPFRVHIGPIATGKAVQKDPELFEQLRRVVRKTLGAEMEASAIGAVAAFLDRRFLIAKAVSDHGDHEKDDRFRAFACKASAEVLMVFLCRHLDPKEESETGSGDASPGGSDRGERRRPRDHEDGGLARAVDDDLLARVAHVYRLRETSLDKIARRKAPPPFGECLEVSVREGRLVRMFPVAATDQPMTEEILSAFLSAIDARYRRENPSVFSTLIHTGAAAPEELLQKAASRGVNLVSFAEHQGLIDFTAYLARQSARLLHDAIYPPSLYVEQRAQISLAGQPWTKTDDILRELRALLQAPHPRFALVLGDFGTGKTFLLHELARRMATEDAAVGAGAPVPVLIEMRALQKQRSLNELIAQHFAAADLAKIDLEGFRYMLREGRIALLFDGFDELALRVTYDRALEHFGTLLQAAEGRAKVVVTSRTQHFLTDHDVYRELADRAKDLPGYRIVKLDQFSEDQIRSFLVKRLKSEPAADERLGLLRKVRDLLGLSENPRMLSFIAELSAEELRAARDGAGEITSAGLYELLIERWLKGEHDRVNPRGAPRGLSVAQLRRAATELAMVLWRQADRTVSLSELPEGLLEAVQALGEPSIDARVIEHQMGSGTLLVRDEDGRFSFIHQSVLEWLVAKAAAGEVGAGGESAALSSREMSDLMVDFFIGLVGREAARAWAATAMAAGEEAAKKNALRVRRRLGEALGAKEAKRADADADSDTRAGADSDTRAGADSDTDMTEEVWATFEEDFADTSMYFRNRDLRGQDLSNTNLRGFDFGEANLSGATLVDADLTGATLDGASLTHADLSRAGLADADLTEADLTGARLLGADLRGAKLGGAKLRRAKLIGASGGALDGCDLFGAAMPSPSAIKPETGADASPSMAMVFAPDGDILATSHDDGTIRLCEVVTGKILRVLRSGAGAPEALAFDRDGHLVSATRTESGIVVESWDMTTGDSRVTSLEVSDTESVLLNPNAERIVRVSSSSPWVVELIDIEHDHVLTELKTRSRVTAVAWSPDESSLAIAMGKRVEVHVVSPTGFRAKREFPSPIHSLTWSPDSARLAVASRDSLTILDGSTCRVVYTLRADVQRAAWYPTGTTLAASWGGLLHLWDPVTGIIKNAPLNDVDVNRAPVWSFDGRALAAPMKDSSVCIWEVDSALARPVVKMPAQPILSAAFREGGGAVSSITKDGSILHWDLTSGRLARDPARIPVSPTWGRLSPDGRTFAHMKDSSFVLYRVGSDGPPSVLKGHVEHVSALAFSPDSRSLASASLDKTLLLWDVQRQNTKILSLSDGAGDLVWSPDGRSMAAVSLNQTEVMLWDMVRLKPVGGFPLHKMARCKVAAFNPDGTKLACALSDGTIGVWPVTERVPSDSFMDVPVGVRRVVFSPDGRLFAAGGRTITIWDMATGRTLHKLEGHAGSLVSLAFSADSRTLLTASTAGTARVWDVESGHWIATLLALPEGWVAFRPDGRYKSGGDTAGAFWHVSGLCRFDLGELDPYLPQPLRIPDDEPFISPDYFNKGPQ